MLELEDVRERVQVRHLQKERQVELGKARKVWKLEARVPVDLHVLFHVDGTGVGWMVMNVGHLVLVAGGRIGEGLDGGMDERQKPRRRQPKTRRSAW